jgi:hypothetical protein
MAKCNFAGRSCQPIFSRGGNSIRGLTYKRTRARLATASFVKLSAGRTIPRTNPELDPAAADRVEREIQLDSAVLIATSMEGALAIGADDSPGCPPSWLLTRSTIRLIRLTYGAMVLDCQR